MGVRWEAMHMKHRHIEQGMGDRADTVLLLYAAYAL
jgi:hypothetical protein